MTMTNYSEQSVAASPMANAMYFTYRTQTWISEVMDKLVQQATAHYEDERGMSTIEYALGCVAAAALGALLYTVVTSDAVESALSGIFERALNEGG